MRGVMIRLSSIREGNGIKNLLPKMEIILLAAFIALVTAIILAQANPLYQFPNRDSGFFMYAGSQLLKGKLLYIDIWDSKGPLIFYINALGLLLGAGSRWGVWGLEFVFLFCSVFIGFILMEKLWGFPSAIFGTLTWLFAFNNVARGGNFTEEYSLLFSFASMYLFWAWLQDPQKRRYPFLIGVTLALNFLLRANNVGVQLSIILVSVILGIFDKNYRRVFRFLLWMGLGAVLIFGIVTLYFYILGSFDEMIQAAILYNFFYSHRGARLDELIGSVTRGFRVLGVIYLLPAVIGYIPLLARSPKIFSSNSSLSEGYPLLFLIGFPVEIVMSGISGSDFAHYYICWSPYIGLLSAYFLYLLLAIFNQQVQGRSLALLFLTAWLIAVFNMDALSQYRTSLRRLVSNPPRDEEFVHPVAQYVRENTNPRDMILVWGIQPYINVLAGRDSPSGVLFYPILAASPFTGELNSRFYSDLLQNKPVMIVDMVNPDNDTIPFIDPVRRKEQERRLRRFRPPSNLDEVFEFIFDNYHVETQIESVVIYRLNDSP